MKPSNPWLTAARYRPDLYVCLADNDDHAELPAGAALAQECGPTIGKAIVLALFGVVAVLCATYGWNW
jgi:hypothetical protein